MKGIAIQIVCVAASFFVFGVIATRWAVLLAGTSRTLFVGLLSLITLSATLAAVAQVSK